MRTQLFFLIILFGLVACSGNEEDANLTAESQSISEDLSSSDFGEDQAFEDEQLEEEANLKPVYLEDIPALWININQNEGEETFYVYHYCEAEDAAIQFMPEKGESWSLYTGYGQDGDVRAIENFEAWSEDVGDHQIINGSFMLKQGDSKKDFIEFYWSTDDMIAEFHGLTYSSTYFIPDTKLNTIEEISEDCEGLWE